jgi:AcrR family transcriptional regulator
MVEVEKAGGTRGKLGRPPIHTPAQVLDRLIDAARAMLDEQGADVELSMAQVAKRAGLSKRTVYTVIASKEELISHIVRRGAASVTAILAQAVPDPASARDVLSRFLHQWEAFACGPRAVGIYVMAIRERSRYAGIGAAYYQSRNEHGLQQLTAWLARMRAKRHFHIEDPAMTAEFALAMVASERQRMLALGMEAPQTPDQLARRVAAVVRLLLPESSSD